MEMKLDEWQTGLLVLNIDSFLERHGIFFEWTKVSYFLEKIDYAIVDVGFDWANKRKIVKVKFVGRLNYTVVLNKKYFELIMNIEGIPIRIRKPISN